MGLAAFCCAAGRMASHNEAPDWQGSVGEGGWGTVNARRVQLGRADCTDALWGNKI